MDSLRDRFIALYASLPYASPRGDYEKDRLMERDFQIVFYLVFMLMGQFIETELHSAKGRADAICKTDERIYIFEFKRDGSAEEALRQIEDSGYALPFSADRRPVVCVGAAFDSEKKVLTEWKVSVPLK